MSGVPIGLDFSAVMIIGAAQGADLELLSEVLPDFEGFVIAALSGDPESSDGEELH